MPQKLLLILCLLGVWPTIAPAHDPPGDRSMAGTDGPHVFYKGDKTIVWSVKLVDTAYKAVSELYFDRSAVRLTCVVPETGDQFSFPLKKELKVENDQWAMPERLLVLSDIEGNFDAMKRTLLLGGVIDAQFRWIYGKGHVVMVGDLFDRGLNVTECMWLLYKLEGEAEAAGGKVHFILGNHEVMNLSGYTEYVRKKYLENARLMGTNYTTLFSADTELGRWLRTKNAIVRIGPLVFCHGGISPELAESNLSIAQINEITRANLGMPMKDIATQEAKLVFNTRSGIFWYRGFVRQELTQDQVERILAYAGGERIVVGHTLVPEISTFYAGRIIAVDLHHEENVRTGRISTLVIERGKLYVVDHHGRHTSLENVAFAKP